MWGVTKKDKTRNKLCHRNNRSNTSIQKDKRETTEMVWACNEKGRIAHSEESTDDRHTWRRRNDDQRPAGKMSVRDMNTAGLYTVEANNGATWRQKINIQPSDPHERENQEDDEVSDR